VSRSDTDHPKPQTGIDAVLVAHEKGRAANRAVAIQDHGDVPERPALLHQLVERHGHTPRDRGVRDGSRLALPAQRRQNLRRERGTSRSRGIGRKERNGMHHLGPSRNVGEKRVRLGIVVDVLGKLEIDADRTGTRFLERG